MSKVTFFYQLKQSAQLLQVTVIVDQTNGYARAPTALVIRGAKGELSRTKLSFKDNVRVDAMVPVPKQTGHYAIDVLTGKHVVSSHLISLLRMNCLGRVVRMKLASKSNTKAFVAPGRQEPGRKTTVFLPSMWLRGDQRLAWVAEWYLNGKRAKWFKGQDDDSDKPTVMWDRGVIKPRGDCTWIEQTPEIRVPIWLGADDKPKRKLKIEGRIYVAGRQAVSVAFTISEELFRKPVEAAQDFDPMGKIVVKLKKIATPKHVKAMFPRVKPDRKFRTLVRSKRANELSNAIDNTKDPAKLKRLRAKLNALIVKYGGKPLEALSRSLGPRVTKAKIVGPPATKPASCSGTVCPSYPAVSRDGVYIVTRHKENISSTQGDYCPPSGFVTRHYKVGKDQLTEVPSRELSGYAPMSCGKPPKWALTKSGWKNAYGSFKNYCHHEWLKNGGLVRTKSGPGGGCLEKVAGTSYERLRQH